VTVQQRTHPPSELADLCPQINLVRRQPWLAKNLKLPKTILSRRVWSCGTSENPSAAAGGRAAYCPDAGDLI